MLSEKSKKNVDACRFCCMCRHLCPLGIALGKELNNPRAKALLLSLVEKNALELSEISKDIYECCLCNACSSNCETGYEPAVFIREVRSELMAQGLAPQGVQDAAERLLKDGTLYHVSGEKALEPYGFRKNTEAETLVYVGAIAAVKDPAMVKAFVSLLDKAGVDYSVFTENLSTGSVEYDLMGGVQEVKDVASACAKTLNSYGAKRIVVLNPSDARMLKQEYTTWELKLNAEVCTATSYVEELVEQGKLHVQKSSGAVTYHDPARLARDLQETEPARKLIEALGYTVKEMWQSKTLTRCTGGEALSSYAPEIIEKTAAWRMYDAVGTGAEMLICACPACEEDLTHASGLPVADLFVLLDQHIA